MKQKNGVMMQYFEWYLPNDCALWKNVAKDAKNLHDNHITAVWLPPAYKGYQGVNDVGYGVYDLYDLGEFDQKGTVRTKYGTKDEYIKAIRALQKNDIEVYGDIVVNHMLGADEVETVTVVENAEYDRNIEISEQKEIKAYTKFTFPGRNGKYSDFVWNYNDFSGVDFDAETKEKAIYNIDGAGWSQNTDNENGSADYLMGANVNFSNPRVVAHLKEWGRWYVDTTHVNGFRLDAVKHIDSEFFADWLDHMRDRYGQEFFAVGEYWNGDRDILENYLDDCERSMALFDVPLHFNMHHASLSDGNFDMRMIFAGTLVESDPFAAVTFVDNHDTQPRQALESTVAEWFLQHAYALILLRPQGYPCIFYGDYYGTIDRDGRAYKDMIDIMTKLRAERLYGLQHDYLDHESLIGWTLEGDEEHKNSGLAVVMTDREGGEKTMYVGKHHAGETWTDVLGKIKDKVVIDKEGNGVFPCLNGNCSVYAKK